MSKFTGKERDGETGLDYFGARFYGSAMGRFTSSDPLLKTLRPQNPQTLNRYTYTLNNPLRYTDPTGQYEEDVHRDLTIVLAQAAGFDEETAARIGAADQGVDESRETGPFASVEARRDYHFTTDVRRGELWRVAHPFALFWRRVGFRYMCSEENGSESKPFSNARVLRSSSSLRHSFSAG